MSPIAVPPKLVWDNILTLPYYQPGKPIEEVQRELGIDDVVKLASNENPYGPSPKVIEALERAIHEIHRYPDALGFAIKGKLAELHGLEREQIGLGNGSDQIISMLCSAFLYPEEEAIVARPSFIRYDTAIQMVHGQIVSVPCKDWTHDLEAMGDAVTPRTKMIFICNPNNPTGTAIKKRDLDRLMERIPKHVLVVFDEAYIEYADDPEYPDTLEYLRAGRRVAILRTFSKAYALAGLRIGYGLTTPELANVLMRVRPPFNTTSTAQKAAIAALADRDHLQMCVEKNRECKRLMVEGLDGLDLDYVPSQTNFIFVDCKRDAKAVFDKLLALGVIVRPLGLPQGPSFMRISIGTREECQRCLAALSDVLREVPRLERDGDGGHS